MNKAFGKESRFLLYFCGTSSGFFGGLSLKDTSPIVTVSPKKDKRSGLVPRYF